MWTESVRHTYHFPYHFSSYRSSFAKYAQVTGKLEQLRSRSPYSTSRSTNTSMTQSLFLFLRTSHSKENINLVSTQQAQHLQQQTGATTLTTMKSLPRIHFLHLPMNPLPLRPHLLLLRCQNSRLQSLHHHRVVLLHHHLHLLLLHHLGLQGLLRWRQSTLTLVRPREALPW